MRHPKRLSIDGEPPAATGRGRKDGRRGIGRRADPVHSLSDLVAAANRVPRDEPVIRRQARPCLGMHVTAQITEHYPLGGH